MIATAVQQKIDDATRRLRDALRPVMIYLYGSYAYGQPHAESDLDLLVIVKDSPHTFFKRSGLAYRALGDLDMPVDVQVYTLAEFEERAQLPLSFERTIKTKGRVLYAA